MGERRLPIPKRAVWHKKRNACWSCSFGVRGLSARVEQRKPGGTFTLVHFIPGPGVDLSVPIPPTAWKLNA